MWNRPANWKWIVASIVLGAAATGLAEDGDLISNTNKNRLTLKGRAAFNIDGRFKGVGALPRTAIGGTGSALDHFYNDGYVRVDISDNAGGQTWFWGYDNASQVSGNNILFHNTTSAGADGKDVNCDPHPGFDLLYNREFGVFGKQKQHRWGLEASFCWTGVGITDKGAARANATRVTDSYSFVAGTTPPAAPFRGTFEGPNFVLNDTPTRTTMPVSGATVRGRREFDGNLFVGHVGPYAEFMLSEKLQLAISGGLALGAMSGDLSFNETVSFTGASPIRHRASDGDGDFLLGGFIGANLRYQFNPRWSVNLGVQFESLGDYSQKAAGHKVEVDLSTMFSVSAGVSYSF